MRITIRKAGAYLDRIGRVVGIVKDRGESERWRWLTTRGYYVTVDGRAAIRGESESDLVVDITPRADHMDAADSMFGCKP